MITSESDLTFEAMSLYKYQSCPSNDRGKQTFVRQILVEHQLYLSSRLRFNDPFDCVVPSLLEIPGADLKRYVEQFVDRKFPDASDTERNLKISKLMAVESLKEVRVSLQKQVDQAGILCFSEVRDDILMWAHYADKHAGLCFEFDGSENCQFFGEAQSVEYADYTPIRLSEDDLQQMQRVILTKAKHWVYEQEYRIFQPGKADSKVDYPVELLTGLIFGCSMPVDVRNSIKQWAEEGRCRVAFFEARPKPREFGLEIVRIG